MKIKHIVLATAAASALLASSSVFAIGASQGFYLGGQLGAAWNNLPSAPGFSENPFAWGINGGYNYRFNDTNFLVGGEIGVNGLGNTKAPTNVGGTGTISYYSVNFLGTATYLLPSNFYVWGETGPSISWYNVSATLPGFGSVSDSSSSKMVWILGAGAGYHWNKWNLFVRYDHYFGDSTSYSGSNFFPQINAVFGGISYTF